MHEWWATQPNPEGLSQGDVVIEIPVGASVFPLVQLKKQTTKGGVEAWVPHETGEHLLFRGNTYNGIVLSHDCEIDKHEKKQRVLVAPMTLLSALPDTSREQVMLQARRSLMPLVGVPTIGDYYADLRLIQAVDRQFLANEQRRASMSEVGQTRLRAQLAVFFLRVDIAHR